MLRRLGTNSEYSTIPPLINQKKNEQSIISEPLTCLIRCHGPDPNAERAKYHFLNYTKYPFNIYICLFIYLFIYLFFIIKIENIILLFKPKKVLK